MNDWAKSWVGKMRRHDQDEQLKAAHFVEAQRLKKEAGPRLWAAVRDEVQANCEDLNKELGSELLVFEFTRHGELTVACNAGRGRKELRANFNSEAGTLNWSSAGRSESRALEVNPDGSVEFWRSTPQSIARNMLDPLLG
jgi:hypothetical protein